MNTKSSFCHDHLLTVWAELKRRVHKREPRTLDDLETSVKRNGLRFLSLYSTTLLDVMGEDSMQIGKGRLYKV